MNIQALQPVARIYKDKQPQQNQAEIKKAAAPAKDSFEVWMDRLGAGMGAVAAVLVAILVWVNVGRGWIG